MRISAPIVSVIIPAYNAAKFIHRTLSSVLSQTYRQIEVLVIDDGSQDETAEIVQAIARSDPRVTLLQQANQGVAAARNLGIAKSTGEFIAPIDADDIWYPRKLEKQVRAMLNAPPTVGLVYTWAAFIDEEDYLTGGYSADREEGQVYFMLLSNNFVGNASTPLIRRECFEQLGGYDTQLRELNAQGCEDWELYLRIAEQYEFRVVPEFLVGYRQVIGSMSCDFTKMARSFHLVMERAQQRNQGFPKLLYLISQRDFYHYLGGLSYRSGHHKNAVRWLSRAIYIDLHIASANAKDLTRLYKVSKLIAISSVKVVARPIAKLLWRDHYAWMRFRRWFRWKPQAEHLPAPVQTSLIPSMSDSLEHPQRLTLQALTNSVAKP